MSLQCTLMAKKNIISPLGCEDIVAYGDDGGGHHHHHHHVYDDCEVDKECSGGDNNISKKEI